MQHHPNRQKLADFLLGRLDAESAHQVRQHIETCATCLRLLGDVPNDRLAMLAQIATRDSTAKSTTVEHNSTEAKLQKIPHQLLSHERYRIIDLIGAGGMGDVYRATDLTMGRDVALKVIRQELLASPVAASRFRNEIRAAASLSHANIVSAFDAGSAGNLQFLAMELVEGESLAQAVERDGPMAMQRALHVARQVAAGLQHAYEKGVIHRDIKPQNVMLDVDDRVRILDFGLTKYIREQLPSCQSLANGNSSDSLGLTDANFALGTPDYIAPEQADNARTADIRADIYSLGCTLYFLLTGQPPFPTGSPLQKISSHLVLERPKLGKTHPSRVNDFLQRSMAREPSARFQTPIEFIAAIDNLVDDLPREALPPSSSNLPSLPPSLGRRSVVRGLLVAAGVLASASFFIVGQRSPKPRRMLIVLSTFAFLPDFHETKELLLEKDIEVLFAAPERVVDSGNGSAPAVPLSVDLTLDQVDPHQIDGLIVCGGGIDCLFPDGDSGDDVQRILSAFQTDEKPICAICDGIEVLVHHDILAGHMATARAGYFSDLYKNEDIIAVDLDVVVDGNVITADAPVQASWLVAEIVKKLEGHD